MMSPLEQVIQTGQKLGIKPSERVLCVQISTQTMQFYRASALVGAYVISTSKRVPSNVKGSLGTPRGLHEIAERIGGGQPAGMVFKGRVPTGRHFSELPENRDGGNLITSRILWLRGLEEGMNRGGEVDSYDRYIYIHGTHDEAGIGTPQSAGCIQMKNLEIMALYDEVRTGDWVFIAA